MRAFLLKTGVFAFAVFGLTGIPYVLIGLWNRWRGDWGSVFYCYAGSRRFIDSYALPGIVAFFRWRPTPIGVMRQGEVWGLVLASPMTEADLMDPANAEDFAALQKRIGRIARMMGVEVINLAGVLPGVLRPSENLRFQDSRPTVVRAVTTAVERMAADGIVTEDVVLLGGAGHVGRALTEALTARGWRCHVVDPRGSLETLPATLRGQPCLLIDISRKGVIGGYIDQMWPELTVLNEVFPAPARRHVAAMTKRGVTVYHLAGVAGRITPPLPHGYESAIPCCAALPGGEPPQVRLVRLNA